MTLKVLYEYQILLAPNMFSQMNAIQTGYVVLIFLSIPHLH